MKLEINLIPMIELEKMGSLTEKEKNSLNLAPCFVLSLSSKNYSSYLNENNFILIDTNKELNKNDFILALDALNGVELFEFLFELDGEWKIKVKSLKDGKIYTKDLNYFTIYGTVISDINKNLPHTSKKENLNNQISSYNMNYYLS